MIGEIEMGEFAVFTEEVAMCLAARGFEIRGKSNTAWFFDDSAHLQKALEEILKSYF